MASQVKSESLEALRDEVLVVINARMETGLTVDAEVLEAIQFAQAYTQLIGAIDTALIMESLPLVPPSGVTVLAFKVPDRTDPEHPLRSSLSEIRLRAWRQLELIEQEYVATQ